MIQTTIPSAENRFPIDVELRSLSLSLMCWLITAHTSLSSKQISIL